MLSETDERVRYEQAQGQRLKMLEWRLAGLVCIVAALWHLWARLSTDMAVHQVRKDAAHSERRISEMVGLLLHPEISEDRFDLPGRSGAHPTRGTRVVRWRDAGPGPDGPGAAAGP
jgi:hypothetical protein